MKVKVKVPLSVTKYHAMEVSGQLHALAALLLGVRIPDTHWIGGWVGSRAGLDAVVRKNQEDKIKSHDEELHNLYLSPNVITVIKSRRMRWTGHVTRMGLWVNEYNILVGGGRKEIT